MPDHLVWQLLARERVCRLEHAVEQVRALGQRLRLAPPPPREQILGVRLEKVGRVVRRLHRLWKEPPELRRDVAHVRVDVEPVLEVLQERHRLAREGLERHAHQAGAERLDGHHDRVVVDPQRTDTGAEVLPQFFDQQVRLLVHQRHHLHHPLPREGLEQDPVRNRPPAVVVRRDEQAIPKEVLCLFDAGEVVVHLCESYRLEDAAVLEGMVGVDLLHGLVRIDHCKLDEAEVACAAAVDAAEKAETREAISLVVRRQLESVQQLPHQRQLD
mmetsp:Transcript_42510/g.141444  ORF Transcript_42510/g.141444 Transcript_42510/m.141444 type:complete len:272 (-) Transcript_42510:128-943(-)